MSLADLKVRETTEIDPSAAVQSSHALKTAGERGAESEKMS